MGEEKPSLNVPVLLEKQWQSGQEAGRLTPCTYALSPQIPQNRKIIGGWHSVCQLEKEKQKEEESAEKRGNK